MPYQQKEKEGLSWDCFSLAVFLVYTLLQVLRWRILPQFMDIYYHILTARGFIQAGGYVGWDFWQYAPVGRVHIYPPFFQIVLAILIKSGANTVILAKFFETAMPLIFLAVLWMFIRRNYSPRLAFFCLVAFSSSFSFYLALLNHIPATLAAVFGLLSLDRFMHRRMASSVILLALCFYTHIGIPWFFSLAVLFYGLMDKEKRRAAFLFLLYAIILSAPVLFKELAGSRQISALGFNLQERNSCQFKIVDYALCLWGLALAFRKNSAYGLLGALFLASFIFLLYPYRFFSAEGYLPVILLCALALSVLYRILESRMQYPRYGLVLILILMFLFSPTLAMERVGEKAAPGLKLKFFDSAFMGMLFAKGPSLWLPQDYILAAGIIKQNSDIQDIIYSTLNPAGMSLAAIAARPTANALLAEIGPAKEFDRFAVSKIIIFPADEERTFVEGAVAKYGLERIGSTRAFILYRNPNLSVKMQPHQASVSFWLIAVIFIAILGASYLLRKRFPKRPPSALKTSI